MSNNLTGQKVSLTYGRLIQQIDSSFYNGLGDLVDIGSGNGVSQGYVDASLNYIKDNYIPDISLGPEFYWNNQLLYVDVSTVQNGVSRQYIDGSLNARDASLEVLFNKTLDPSIDYTTYTPRVSDTSFYYDLNDNVIEIISNTDIGQKTISFVYNNIGDVSTISINNYGIWNREISFDLDINGNVIASHII